MQATELKGICPIIATPFTEKGAVDYDSFANLVRTLIQGGCHAVTLFGIAGEYYKLTDEEMIRLARATATGVACWVTERMLVPPYWRQVSMVRRARRIISSSVSL